MESLERQNNLICCRIFLPYNLNQVLMNRLPIYKEITKGKSVFENFMSRILQQINFLCPSRDSIGILEMDSEGIFGRTIVFELKSTQHSVVHLLKNKKNPDLIWDFLWSKNGKKVQGKK